MHNSLANFKQSKHLLIQVASILSELGIERKEPALAKRASDFCQKVESATFNLAVVGEFKRGKSTLVNALIGANLLPMAVIPLTSIATIISFADATKIIVKFANNKTIEISENNLINYVTEGGNPNNEKLVSSVAIEFSASLLKDGVRLIDTPGIGSAFQQNTNTTYDYLPEIDAAIFLFSADQPASQVELAFLKDVNGFAPKTFLVQNKIDHLSPDELEQSLNYLRQTVSAHFQGDAKIYPISAKLALARKLNARLNIKTAENNDGFDFLEKEIVDFLVNGKAQTLIKSSSQRLAKEIASTKRLLELEQHSRQLPLSALQEAIKAFAVAADSIRQEQSDAEFIIKGEADNLVRDIGKDLSAFVETRQNSVIDSINHAIASNENLGKADMIAALRQSLFEQIQTIFDQWKLVEEATVASKFAKITARFAERGNLIIDQIRAASKEHLGVDAAVHFEIEALTNDSRHRYVVDDPFTLAVESLPLLLPAVLAKPIIAKRFLQAAKSELSRNSGRLRADFQERISKTTRAFLVRFTAQVNDSLLEIQTTAERALSKESQSAEDCRAADKILLAQLSQLDNATQLLAEI
ncbi:hypothetical protein BH11CYA1_BH11CYA1_22720 [soil metagenome]